MTATVPVLVDHRKIRQPDLSEIQKDGNACVTGYEILEDRGDTMLIEYRAITRPKK